MSANKRYSEALSIDTSSAIAYSWRSNCHYHLNNIPQVRHLFTLGYLSLNFFLILIPFNIDLNSSSFFNDTGKGIWDSSKIDLYQ